MWNSLKTMLWGLVLEDGGCRAAPGLSLSLCRSRTDAVAPQSSLFMKGDDDVLYLTYNDIIGQFRHTNRSLLLERIEIVVISPFTAGVESQQLLSSAHRLQLSFFLFSVARFSCPRSLRQVRGPVILPGASSWPLPLSHSFVFQGGNEAARSRPLFQNVSLQRVQSEQRWRTDITAAIDNLPWHAVIFLFGGVTSQRFEIQKWDSSLPTRFLSAPQTKMKCESACWYSQRTRGGRRDGRRARRGLRVTAIKRLSRWIIVKVAWAKLIAVSSFVLRDLSHLLPHGRVTSVQRSDVKGRARAR